MLNASDAAARTADVLCKKQNKEQAKNDAAAEAHAARIKSAIRKSKKIFESANSAVLMAVSKGKTRAQIVTAVKYNKILDDLKPHNIIGTGFTPKSKRIQTVFPDDHPWKYVQSELQSYGYDVVFEYSITSLDELGDPIYILSAYWD